MRESQDSANEEAQVAPDAEEVKLLNDGMATCPSGTSIDMSTPAVSPFFEMNPMLSAFSAVGREKVGKNFGICFGGKSFFGKEKFLDLVFFGDFVGIAKG
jgi:hypothetical protein